MTKLLTISVPYTFVRSGYFYFSRRVPSDLQAHYSCPRIVVALNTQSKQQAKTLAQAAAASLDVYWAKLRLARSEIIGQHLVRSGTDLEQSSLHTVSTVSPKLSEALDLYLSLKGVGRPVSFEAAARRACGYVFEVAGDKALLDYRRTDALSLRDWLKARGQAGSSITRNFSSIKAVFNFACSEWAIEAKNPFVGVFHDRTAGVVSRSPIPLISIRHVQKACFEIDDDLRWLVALVADTGLRLAEAAGLSKEDFQGLGTSLPYIRLVKHPWRNLKTDSSERLVPLTGSALWAAQRLLQADNAAHFAFPRYNRQETTSANAASAALNKWMKAYVPEGCTMHGFRHSMRDRLRAVECPTEIADQLGGWTAGSVGQGYGTGYPLEILHKWIEKAVER